MTTLSPMQLGEILDATFGIFRRHFALFMKLSMIVMWLPAAIWLYLRLHYGGTGGAETMLVLQEHPLGVVLVSLAMGVLYTIASLLLTAGSIRIISDSYLGRTPRLGDALALGASRIWPLFLVAVGKTLLVGVICAVGVALIVLIAALGGVVGVLLAVVGTGFLVWFIVFVAAGYGVTTPVVVLEDLSSSFDAFGRSWDLTRGLWRKVLGVAAVAWLVSQFLPSMVVGVLSAALTLSAPGLIPLTVALTSFVGILLAPILPCAMTLLYYDLRVRREAFDLQVLSQQLGIS